MHATAGRFAKAIVFALSALLLVSAALAQDPCNITPGTCRTQTQGGWGADCHGQNPGCLLQNNFTSVFPSGIVIGGTFTLTFTSSAAVNAFLPAGGTPDVLTASQTDPTSSEAGVFAGQVLALAISLGFSNAAYPGFCDLGSLVIPVGVHNPYGPFAGWSVNQVFALANVVLGGDLTVLPAGITLSDLNDVIDAINSNFDDGTVNEGFLVEPDCDEILPVELVDFTAVGNIGNVEVIWVTASEHNVTGYELSRQSTNGTYETIAHVTGLGDNPAGHTYTYRDAAVVPGTAYNYRLTMREVDGSVHPLGIIASATPRTGEVPTAYALSQNYPNPFNPSTTIAFDLVDAGNVSLKIYNLMGQQVANLVHGNMSAGHHAIAFDASSLPSGIYLYRLSANGFVAEKKMLLMK